MFGYSNIKMGMIKNLFSDEAAAKIKQLAESANICLFTTALSYTPLSTRPMGTMKVDDDGALWFFSSRGSEKNAQLALDSRVQLFYANNTSAEFLSVYGDAMVIRDNAKAKELWTPLAKTWFQEGAEDPELTIIKVTPHEAYYWDTQHNKMITLAMIVTGAIVGKRMDDGVEGKMEF